jgi:elongation factor G
VVKLRVEPLASGEGYQYETQIVGGTVPKEYHASVGEGAEEATKRGGVRCGFPVTDIKVTLIDGSYHEVDSSEMAFSIAGSIAMQEAFRKGDSVILEPVMDLEIVTPEEFLGEVIGDAVSRRGIITAQENIGKTRIVKCEVPLAQMFGYSNALRGKTQGRASFTMQFGKYQELPEGEAQNLIRERERLKEGKTQLVAKGGRR